MLLFIEDVMYVQTGGKEQDGGVERVVINGKWPYRTGAEGKGDDIYTIGSWVLRQEGTGTQARFFLFLGPNNQLENTLEIDPIEVNGEILDETDLTDGIVELKRGMTISTRFFDEDDNQIEEVITIPKLNDTADLKNNPRYSTFSQTPDNNKMN